MSLIATEQSKDTDVHVMPNDNTHECSSGCWCEPEIEFQANNGRGGNKNARQWEFTGQDFQYDPNVGVKISSKTLVVDGNATNAMILPGTGNVGIGSRAPTALLHVSSGTLVIDGTGAPVTASALCLDASGRLGHCTSIVGVDGTCTCTSP